MIGEGLLAYVSHDKMFESRDAIVRAIYRAMHAIEDGTLMARVASGRQKHP